MHKQIASIMPDLMIDRDYVNLRDAVVTTEAKRHC